MGWWSESIMGGDQPLDIQADFEDCFASATAENSESVIGPITADEALAFMHDQIKEDDDPVTRQVVGFLLIQNGAPLPEEARKLVLEGIDQEINAESDWNDPALRHKALSDFAAIVEVYPAEGGKVDLPYQPVLFEKIFGTA